MKKVLFLLFIFLSVAVVAQAGIHTEEIKYSAGGSKLTGYLAYDDSKSGKRPGVLVIHEWWGHNKHARERAKMLAKLGYTALAVDMYGDGKLADHPKKAGEFMNAAFKDWEGSVAKFHAAKTVLMTHKTVDPGNIGAIGFCFGGAISQMMARAGEPLKGIVAFHSALPNAPAMKKGQVTASILVINGGDDEFLNSDAVATFGKEMKDADVDFTYMSLKGVRHSYTNPQADALSKKFGIPAMKYDAAADKRAWSAMQNFFKRVFGK